MLYVLEYIHRKYKWHEWYKVVKKSNDVNLHIEIGFLIYMHINVHKNSYLLFFTITVARLEDV